MALVRKQGGPVYGRQFGTTQPGGMPRPQEPNPYQQATEAQKAWAQSHGETLATSDPGGGQGKDFTAGRQAQAARVMQAGLTGSEAGDYANREALRQALAAQISQYGGASDAREQNFLGNQERQLSRNVAQLRRQMGGTGLQGSSQANRSLGELLAASQRETGQGLNQLQLQKGQELAQLGATQGGLLQQALAERGYTLQQAQALATLLQNQAALEQGSIMGTMQPVGPSTLERGLGYGLGLLGTAAGAAGGLGWKPFGT